MTLAGFARLRFAHLVSNSDQDLLDELLDQALPVRAVGFSEWKSDSIPEVSLGWDWLIAIQSNQFFLSPDAIRSNLMLIDTHGYDLGAPVTSNLLRVWLNTVLDWQKAVRIAIDFPVNPSCQL